MLSGMFRLLFKLAKMFIGRKRGGDSLSVWLGVVRIFEMFLIVFSEGFGREAGSFFF